MPYIVYTKESDSFKLFGSLPLIIDQLGFNKFTLEYHFSRKKETEFENESYRIIKVKLERGGKAEKTI